MSHPDEQSPYVKDPANPTDAELSAAIQRGLNDGTLIDSEAWLAEYGWLAEHEPETGA